MNLQRRVRVPEWRRGLPGVSSRNGKNRTLRSAEDKFRANPLASYYQNATTEYPCEVKRMAVLDPLLPFADGPRNVGYAA